MKTPNYKEMEAYKKSYDCVMLIYKMTENFPIFEQYGIVSQLRKAAVSIPTNIAEGHKREPKEFVHFLQMAVGSSAEIETLLSMCKEMNYCDDKELKKVYDLNADVLNLLNNDIKKLSNG